MSGWLIIGIIAFEIFIVAAIFNRIHDIKEKDAEKEKAKLAQQKLEDDKRELFIKYKEEVKKSLDIILSEKTQGFPWLATAIAEYYANYDNIFATYLTTKPRPAFIQADRIREIAKEKKLFKKEFLTSKYIIEYYESLFPWLREYVGFNSEELIQSIYKENIREEEDPVYFYVPESRNNEKLSVSERNQRALDRYWNRDKDPWQVGRDYERYIGYLYENKGYKVQYHGIEKLKEDLGRDLICTKGELIEIVQCKYWSSQKGIPIRENHITQLYGTTVKYFLDHKINTHVVQLDLFPDLLKKSNIIPVLTTTTVLSETAKDFAKVLGIRIDKISMVNDYPSIKCNINFQTNDRIYHLPFDQQYDNTKIDTSKGERWAKTVKEAESYDFRRAWRWKPSKEE